MSNYSNSNETFGSTALTAVLIFLSVFLAVAFLASTLPNVGGQPAQSVAQIVSTDQNA